MKIQATPKAILYALSSMIALCALFSFLTLLPSLYKYVAYYKPIDVELERLEIVELGENFYVPKATYSYGVTRQEELLETRAENNPYLLEERLQSFAKEKPQGYLNGLNHCTLQKCFPVKQSVYTLILIALTLYFYFLGRVRV